MNDIRVPLAMERTFLAWVRTGLAMMGFGFVVARFGLFLREVAAVESVVAEPPGRGISVLMGTALVALGVVVSIYAAFRFHHDLARLEAGRPPSVSATVPTAVAITMAAIGAATVWYFVTFG